MVPGFPESEQDTTCLPAVQNYVGALASQRPDLAVHVIAFQYPFRRGTYRWNGATIHALAGRNRGHVRRLSTWARAARVFARLRRHVDIRVLHTFWLTECAGVGQWLGRVFGVPHVASIGGLDAQGSNRYLRRLDLQRMVVTAGSPFAAEVFERHADGAPAARVVPLGLDTAHLEAIPAAPRRDIDILAVGSLIPLKDHAAFLDIVAGLRDEFPLLQACIVGGGPLREQLGARVAALRLGDNVRLTGPLPRDDAFRTMLRSRVLLHTASYESQAYVFLEALFAGLDVVCFDVGYGGDSDRMHRCRSREELAATCLRLMRQPPVPVRQPVPTVDDTVRAFEAIYGV